MSPTRDGSGLAVLLLGHNRPVASGQLSVGTRSVMSVCVGGGCPWAVRKGLGLQWPSQESSSFPRPLHALFLEMSPPRNLGRAHGGLGVYKYLQIFLVLVDVVELEDMWVLNELQDGNLPLHLGEKEWRSALPPSLPPAPKGPLFPQHTDTPSSAPTRTASPGSRS